MKSRSQNSYPLLGLALAVIAALLLPAAAQARMLLLDANFDNRTPGDSLARRGAIFGEPISGPNDMHNEVVFQDAPGDNSIEIPDTRILGADELYWAVRGNREIVDGKLFISCELEFVTQNEYHVTVRSADLVSGDFFQLTFDSTGNFYWSDGDNPSPTLAGVYGTAITYELELEFNLDNGNYNCLWNGLPVVTGGTHGVTGQGIGALVVGHTNDGNATGSLRLDLPSLSWRPGSIEQILSANFNDQPLGQPIGFGGAALGQPVSASGSSPNVEVGPPNGNPALVLEDESAVGTSVVRFEFLNGIEPATPLSVSFWLAFAQLETYVIYVREQGTSAEIFLNIKFNSAGQVMFSDASDGGNVHTVHSYATGTPIRVEMAFEPQLGFYSVWWNGERIVYREAHGISARNVGRLIFGCDFDADLDGVMYLDALKVHTLLEPGTVDVLPAVQTAARMQAAPNPFNPATEISFELAREAQVSLDIFDSRGRRVARLVEGALSAGRHSPTWRGLNAAGRRMPSGIYHAVLRVDGQISQRVSMTLVK